MVKPDSPYNGAGPVRSALPGSVVLLERVRQALITAGMDPSVSIADWTFAQGIDCCIRNGVDLGNLPQLTVPQIE